MLLAMAWRNVLRSPRRSALTAIGMALAVVVCASMMALTEGMFGQMRDVLITRSLGHVQVHHPEWPEQRRGFDVVRGADALLPALDALPGAVRSTSRVFGSALLGAGDQTEGAMLFGVLPEREDALRGLSEDVVEGAWLSAAPGAQLVLGRDLARKLGVKPGDTVVAVTQALDGSLGNELYTVAGTVLTGNPGVDRAGAYLHAADLRTLLAMGSDAHELVVVGQSDDEADILALAEGVRGVLGEAPSLVRPWWEVDPTTATLFGMQQVSGLLLMFFFYGISAVGVVNTLLMSVFERTRELGVMRALGMRPREVVLLIVIEAIVLSVVAVAVGLVGTAIADAWLVVQGIDLSVRGEGLVAGDMTFDPVIRARVTAESIVQPVVGVFLFSVLAAIWPAVRAARLEPVDAIREGQG